MEFVLGDIVRYIETPLQIGVVDRLHPLAVDTAIVVKWNVGPLHSQDQMCAYFGDQCDILELVPLP